MLFALHLIIRRLQVNAFDNDGEIVGSYRDFKKAIVLRWHLSIVFRVDEVE